MRYQTMDLMYIEGDNFASEIAALEEYMDSLQYEIAIEADVGSNNEPDGSRLRNAYSKLSQAIKSKNEKRIADAKAEVASASAEVDQKVKDPEKKKRIIRIGLAAASAAALTVGAILVANDLKNGDLNKIRSAGEVMRKTISRIGDKKKGNTPAPAEAPAGSDTAAEKPAASSNASSSSGTTISTFKQKFAEIWKDNPIAKDYKPVLKIDPNDKNNVLFGSVKQDGSGFVRHGSYKLSVIAPAIGQKLQSGNGTVDLNATA